MILIYVYKLTDKWFEIVESKEKKRSVYRCTLAANRSVDYLIRAIAIDNLTGIPSRCSERLAAVRFFAKKYPSV